MRDISYLCRETATLQYNDSWQVRKCRIRDFANASWECAATDSLYKCPFPKIAWIPLVLFLYNRSTLYWIWPVDDWYIESLPRVRAPDVECVHWYGKWYFYLIFSFACSIISMHFILTSHNMAGPPCFFLGGGVGRTQSAGHKQNKLSQNGIWRKILFKNGDYATQRNAGGLTYPCCRIHQEHHCSALLA